MIELYINNKLCELGGDTEIAVDYSIAKIGELEKPTGTRSYEIKLPKTAINRGIFENPDDVNNSSTIPYSRLDARLFADGIDQKIKFARLQSSSSDYTINIYGGNSNFYALAKENKLKDFNFCSWNHFWTLANVVASRNNTTGYIYPVIDYGEDASMMGNITREVDVRMMYPSLFYDDILSKCIQELGYSFSNEQAHPDYLLVYSGEEFTRVTNGEYMLVKTETTSDQAASYNIFHQMFFDYHQLTQDCNFWVLGTTVETIQLNFQDMVTVSGHLHWVIDNTTGVIQVMDLNMGSDILGTPEFSETIALQPGINTIDRDFTLTNLPAQPPIYFTLQQAGDPAMTVKSGSYVELTSVTVNEVVEIEYVPYGSMNGYITPSSLFGEITLGDLIRNYCGTWGMMIDVNEDDKSVSLVKFDRIEKNISQFIDWSDKLDLTDEPEVISSPEDYAQRNLYEYTEDGDEKKPLGTDGVLTISDEYLPLEETKVSLDFAASLEVMRLIDIPVNQIGVIIEGLRKNTKVQRVLNLLLVDSADFTNTTDLVYTDGTSTSNVNTNIPTTYFISASQTSNLGFGNSLLADNYSTLSNILSNYKQVNADLRINASDINQLDFLKPVYLQYFNAYFYRSFIKGHKAANSEATPVELVKIF